jgi:hypothetical protein
LLDFGAMEFGLELVPQSVLAVLLGDGRPPQLPGDEQEHDGADIPYPRRDCEPALPLMIIEGPNFGAPPHSP